MGAAAGLNSTAPSATPLRRLPALAANIRGTPSPESPTALTTEFVARFSWSKLQELVRIDDPLKRAFYENECLEGNWSVRQLQRRLRCHVLLDLKVRPFQHGDAGQMNFYLNWWRKNGVEPGDNPPVGILLCSERDQTKVEFATAGMDNKLFVSRYLVNLPSAEQLRRSVEADRTRVETILRLNEAPLKRTRRQAGKAAGQDSSGPTHQQNHPVSRSRFTPGQVRLTRGHARARHCT